MHKLQNTYMVWPPIPADIEPEILGRTMAMLGWFAGPTAKKLRVPCRASLTNVKISLPAHASLSTVSDLNKLELMDSARAFAALEQERHILLLLDRNVDCDDVLAAAMPLPGSQALAKVSRPRAEAARHDYYYFGNPDEDLQDAYHAVCLTHWVSGGEDKALLEASLADLLRLRVQAGNKKKISLFGTGPSLSEALERDYSDSFNIICNTIIKNQSFVARLDPQILVAADAHFHFSYHRYSARFLSDLILFLDRSGGSFYTFDKFAAFLRQRLPEIADRVYGIPAGRSSYGFDFDKDFRLFPGDSVLNMFMLPLASFLGKEVVLNGFTGRAPSDSYFWNHSELHQYVDLMEDVRQAHPAFFRNRDYGQYANAVDDDITVRVNAARVAGTRVRSDTTTFYSALQK